MIGRRALLELLYRAEVGQVPVRYVVRERSDQRLTHLANQAAYPHRVDPNVGSESQPLPSGVDETVHRCWVKDPSHFRVDSDQGRTVVAGIDTFTWPATPEGGDGLIRFARYREQPVGAAAMEGRSLLAEGDPEIVEDTTYLGRPAYLVRATPALLNEPARSGRLRAPVGADERRLVVDAEHGLILRDEAFFAGESMHLHEITELEFDPTFDDDTFAFASPDGGAPAVDDTPATEHVSIDAASELVGFRCLVPAAQILYMRFAMAAVHRYRDGRIAVETTQQDGGQTIGVSVIQSDQPPAELPPEALEAVRAGGHWEDGDAAHLLHDDVWVRVAVTREGSLRRRTGRLKTIGPIAPPELDALAIARDLVPYPTTAPQLVPVDLDGQPT